MKRYGTSRVINVNHPCQIAHLERTASDGPLPASTCAAFDTQVSIRITSYRCRLVDVDGVSGKAALDALVLAGVLADDSTKEIREVLYHQEKVKIKGEEKTVITITRV